MTKEYVKNSFLNAMAILERNYEIQPDARFQNKSHQILEEEFERICSLYLTSTITGQHPSGTVSGERPYHNLGHVESCINAIGDRLADCEKSLLTVALVYHDCVFLSVPRFAGQNEKDSSMEAFNFLHKEFGLQAGMAGRVADIILATAHSDTFPITRDDLFGYARDIDIASLGINEQEFILNSKRIRSEYSPTATNIYIENSIGFVTKLLRRDRIYSMSIFADKYEDQARINLKNYLDSLNSI